MITIVRSTKTLEIVFFYCVIFLAAARRYRELYRNRRQPNRKQKEYGTFRVKHCAGRPTAEEEEDVLERVAENPNISERRLSTATGVSRTSVHNILRTQLL